MSFRRLFALLLLLLLIGCEDLDPSSTDRRTAAVGGTIGPGVGQLAPDFALFDTLSNTVQLTTELAGVDGVVLYFTMWCPVCDSHMNHMRSQTIPDYPNVAFYFVDYVSGTIALSRSAQVSNGYAANDVLVDDIQHVLDLYDATMGTTVVIDSAGVVQMNEDYKDGSKLDNTLAALP